MAGQRAQAPGTCTWGWSMGATRAASSGAENVKRQIRTLVFGRGHGCLDCGMAAPSSCAAGPLTPSRHDELCRCPLCSLHICPSLPLRLPTGDVAFTKHSIALQYAKDGLTPEPWSTKAKVGARQQGPLV